MRDDFAIFILTHGRPTQQSTKKLLRDIGYSGKIYLVLDNTDETIQKYIDNHNPNEIFIFDKNAYINSIDVGSNQPLYKCIVYAKAAVEDIAKSLNLSAFAMIDDDVYKFRHRFVENNVLRSVNITKNFDALMDNVLEYLFNADLTATSFCYTSFYICGIDAFSEKRMQRYRIPYTFVIRNAKHPFEWSFDYGEDIISAILADKRGDKLTMLPDIQIDSTPPDKRASGGMSETYAQDTAKLIFREIIAHPDIITARKYHGKYVGYINRDNAFPKIMNERYKK